MTCSAVEKWCTFGNISIYLAYGGCGLADTTAQGQGLEPAKRRRQSFINLALTTGIAKSKSVAETLSKSRPNDGRARGVMARIRMIPPFLNWK
ncbi:MAG: hypothetical protein E7Z96_05830 [Actinomycetaceae bacterium]|nr:hypothetical protein [Actinomycetaceae bacterium]